MTYWVGVVSRDHVQLAVAGGFCQIHHGKEAPLKRMRRGDHILYYSPREQMGQGAVLQAFTAIGRIEGEEPYRAKLAGDFQPFRRAARYFKAHDAPIKPLLGELALTRGRASWGQVLRSGCFTLEHDDYVIIARAMGVSQRL